MTIRELSAVSAVAGFRIDDTLAFGRIVYVDDLCTLPAARRRGHTRALLRSGVHGYQPPGTRSGPTMWPWSWPASRSAWMSCEKWALYQSTTSVS